MRRLHCCYPPPIKHKVVTKYVLIMMVASVFMVGFNFLERRSLFLNWNLIWNKFEVWRLITSATTLGPPSMKVSDESVVRFFFKDYIGIRN